MSSRRLTDLGRAFSRLLVLAIIVGLGDQVGVWRAATPSEAVAATIPHSLQLNGTTALVEVTPAPDLNLIGDWTVELWLKDTDPNGFLHDYRYLINKG